MAADLQPALILLGHGTRDEEGRREFGDLVDQVDQALHDVVVRYAFLELQEPDLCTVVRRLYDEGTHHQVICPILLLASGHARRDVPHLASRLRDELACVKLHITQPLGTHPSMHQLSARRAAEILETRPELPATGTVSVLVARGGADEDLASQLKAAGQGRSRHLNISTTTAFLALAEPAWSVVSSKLLESEASCIIVQPYLLFQGQMLSKLALDTQELQRKAGQRQQWYLATHLGAEVELVQAVKDRFREVFD